MTPTITMLEQRKRAVKQSKQTGNNNYKGADCREYRGGIKIIWWYTLKNIHKNIISLKLFLNK